VRKMAAPPPERAAIDRRSMRPLSNDLAGRLFGKLTAVEPIRSPVAGRPSVWRCICDCGSECFVVRDGLLSGKTTSCGCGRVSHGHTKGSKPSPTYSTWKAMMGRCTQPANAAYEYYRENGIVVCDRWLSFDNFLADMGERPSLSHSIDRFPNKMGNYEPGNCRWATKREQANNRVTNVTFEYQGESVTFAELVRRTGMPKDLLRHRLLRAGWPLELALSAPLSQGQLINR
jgi:hypothetical protein